MKTILVPLAEGCEELEAVAIIDTLRRARFKVIAAGLRPGPLTASRGVVLVPDTTLDRVSDSTLDAIVLPGGNGGVQALMADDRVVSLVRRMHDAGKWVCAVCAAPLVLQKAGVLAGRRATCYPGAPLERRVDERVVVDANILTSQGPGTAIDFALEIVRRLGGDALAGEVRAGMIA